MTWSYFQLKDELERLRADIKDFRYELLSDHYDAGVELIDPITVAHRLKKILDSDPALAVDLTNRTEN